ncbi:MAG: pentapeptide repeat-containing protein [Armatimonadota bacterium]
MAQWLEASNLIEATRMAELLGHLEPSGVGVCDASMYGADLRGANLNSADLRGARLHGAILPQAAERRGPTLGRAAPLGMDVRGPSEADKSVGAAGCAWLVTSLRQRRDISISLENRSPESLTAVAVMVGIGVSVGVLVDVMLVAGYAFGSTLGSVAGMLMGSVAGLTLLLVCGGKSEAGRRPWLAPGTVAGIALGVLISVFAPLGTDAAWGVGMAIGIVVANWVAYGL